MAMATLVQALAVEDGKEGILGTTGLLLILATTLEGMHTKTVR